MNPANGRGMRYLNDVYLDALDIPRSVEKKRGLTEAECALRWITHYSLLTKEHGDGIIIGASSTKHMAENMKFLDDHNPLPKDLARALDERWGRVQSISG